MKRIYNLKPDPIDPRDFIFEAQLADPEFLAKKVDLRPKCSPVVDQGQLGSCTANAIASGLREYYLITNGEPLTRLSRLYLYWHERQIEGTIYQDSGAYIRDGMKVLASIGVCPEADYPYDINNFTNTPDGNAEGHAGQFRIKEYHRIKALNDLKAALSQGQPVVIGIPVYESFESQSVAETGIIPMPKPTEQLLGGHAILIVGYDDDKGYAIVRNSWGEGWGDKGYCYIPYTFFTKYASDIDMWTGTVSAVKPNPTPVDQTVEQRLSTLEAKVSALEAKFK